MADTINTTPVPVSVPEQTTVLGYIKRWLESLSILSGLDISISSLDLQIGGLSIVPTTGVRKQRQYACGGYQVYFPFTLYYRTASEGTDEIAESFNLLDQIGIEAMDCNLNTLLGADMTADSFSQNTTTVLLARAGAVSDYKTDFVLIYSV